MLRHFLAEHEANLLLLGGDCNLGINLVDANRQLGSLQLGLWCFLGMDTP